MRQILFLDIETVPIFQQFADLPDEGQQLWADKSRQFQKSASDTPESLYEKAGIYAEFGKVVCISVGIMQTANNKSRFRVHSYCGSDEASILHDFATMLQQIDRPGLQLCGHNIREFDVPFLCRRMLINQIDLPPLLDLSGLKPWEVRHIDTLQLWKFGDYKHYTSLKLLSWCFGIPSPKNDIDGSEVARVYYVEQNLARIRAYCERDVVGVARLYLKMGRQGDLPDELIESSQS
jgi:predicted PolB exonuclease-like 3'-5' exonuclease